MIFACLQSLNLNTLGQAESVTCLVHNDAKADITSLFWPFLLNTTTTKSNFSWEGTTLISLTRCFQPPQALQATFACKLPFHIIIFTHTAINVITADLHMQKADITLQ